MHIYTLSLTPIWEWIFIIEWPETPLKLPLKRLCFRPPGHAKGRGVFRASFKHVSDTRFYIQF
jgi:hypothetical protein